MAPFIFFHPSSNWNDGITRRFVAKSPTLDPHHDSQEAPALLSTETLMTLRDLASTGARMLAVKVPHFSLMEAEIQGKST